MSSALIYIESVFIQLLSIINSESILICWFDA